MANPDQMSKVGIEGIDAVLKYVVNGCMEVEIDSETGSAIVIQRDEGDVK